MSLPQSNHFTRLERACGTMGVKRWRAIKGLIYVLIMAFVAVAGMVEDSWVIAIAFIFAAMLIFGIEIQEVQIADYVNVKFQTELEGVGENGDAEE